MEPEGDVHDRGGQLARYAAGAMDDVGSGRHRGQGGVTCDP